MTCKCLECGKRYDSGKECPECGQEHIFEPLENKQVKNSHTGTDKRSISDEEDSAKDDTEEGEKSVEQKSIWENGSLNSEA